MPIENSIFQTSVDTLDQARRIEEASLWAGISKGVGRSSEYSKLLRELVEKECRSPKHILAWHESADVTEMHELWNSKEKLFPGLKDKICEVLRNGPVLCQEENCSSSNRARNDAFNYLLAGRMLAADLKVLAVDECQSHANTEVWKGDITLEHEGVIFDVQCKRPRGFDSLERNVLRARDQIITVARPLEELLRSIFLSVSTTKLRSCPLSRGKKHLPVWRVIFGKASRFGFLKFSNKTPESWA